MSRQRKSNKSSRNKEINKIPEISEEILKKIFWLILSLMLIVMISASLHYGMNWDEPLSKAYGDYILNFYLSLGKDRSLETNPSGTLRAMALYYGGFVELISSIINKISSRDPYDDHHLITSIFGFIGVLFCALTTKELSNWRGAIIAACFLFLTPVYFANSMHNSKDIPFAVANIAALYFMVIFLKKWPEVDYKVSISLSISILIAIGIRAGGVILIGYLGLFFLVKSFYSYSQSESASKKDFLKELSKGALHLGILVLVSYLGSLLFWPYALSKPLEATQGAISFFSNISEFDSYNLFEGNWIHRWEIPWYYIPKWIFISTPLFISFAPLALIGLFFLKSKINKDQLLFCLMILFTTLFPIAFVILRKSNVYDGWRHMYFVYPPLVVLCALAWNKLFSIENSTFRKAIVAVLALLLLDPLFFMLRNHPNEQFYFSPLIGGVRGAFKKYEIDYYGTSLRGAVEWLAKSKEVVGSKNKLRVNSLYGEPRSAIYYISKYPNFVYVGPKEVSDYSLVLPSYAKHDKEILVNWPPKNTVHQIKVDDVPIIAIVKNDNIDLLAKLKTDSTDVNFLLNLSLEFFLTNDYPHAIVVAEKVLLLDPNNAIAYNNICSSLNSLFLFAEAIEAGKKATEIAPDFQLARNNYTYSLSKKDERVDPKVRVRNLLNISVAFFENGNQAKSIEFSERVLALDPNNALAYNNLCVAYIALKQIDKAISAAETALRIAPDFQLAKNNLALAKSQK